MNKIIKNSACIIVFLFGIYFLSIGIYESYVAGKNSYNDESLIIQLWKIIYSWDFKKST